MIYDSTNDPTAACHQSEMSAAESLADILKSSATETGDPEEPPSRRSASGGDSGNLSTNSEMKEVMGELSLSAPLAARLGPASVALPNLAQQAMAPATLTTATSATQGDLDKLRRPDGRSRQLNRVWRDMAEYERQKGEMERRSHEQIKRASSQAGRSDNKRKSRSRSRLRTKASSGGSPPAGEAPPEEKPVLKWIPGKKEEYPVHYAEDRMHSFVMWAERHTLDEHCKEVRAMRYIVDHEVVVRKIIALIHWSLVYGSLKLRNPVPQQVVGLEAINRDMQAPLNALFPIRFAQQHDLRSRAQTKWENIASWVQYWFDTLQKVARPDMFFGGDARLISPLVYFIFHHVNRVLELPMRMKEILGNTG